MQRRDARNIAAPAIMGIRTAAESAGHTHRVGNLTEQTKAREEAGIPSVRTDRWRRRKGGQRRRGVFLRTMTEGASPERTFYYARTPRDEAARSRERGEKGALWTTGERGMSKMKRDAAIAGRASAAARNSGRNKRCRRRGSNRTSKLAAWIRRPRRAGQRRQTCLDGRRSSSAAKNPSDR